ncbi:hypothetical protein PR202_ga25250 [Eleusine coracana subsp. coracana]|uniref:Glycosyltransferase N-terminal domain-containing protein n=1 Tax=Eleusine coracana subsp. coracana TaxID=191504 RepID=A0AAV5DBR3_ELECO|nr:hypothetical protein PR202_ga25250 [Eleusine coracana subsp. coracana]
MEPKRLHFAAGSISKTTGIMAGEDAHVLVFPVPAQGHLNCMLHFATGLLRAGLHVTFLHTDHSLRRLGAAAAACSSPRLRFLSIPRRPPRRPPAPR